MAKLQLACDLIELEKLMEMMPELLPYVDIFEMGTPMNLRYGTKAAETIKKAFPSATVLADIKIFDGGGAETKLFTDVGASYITVMSRTNDVTIKSTADACHEGGAECMVDLMCETDLATRVPQLEALGADICAVHVAYDDYVNSGLTPLKSLEALSKVVKTAKMAVAGGIKLENIKDYMKFNPDIVIVGGSILGADDPVAMAKAFSEAVR